MTFIGDSHEPRAILDLLQPIPFFEEGDLRANWSDYYYDGAYCFCHESNIYNTERKTIMDLVNDLDGVEEQLQKALSRHPDVHNRFIVEGIWEPSWKGLIVYSKYPGKTQMVGRQVGERQGEYRRVQNWLHQIGKFWEVVQTSSMTSTASTLTSLYHSDQEDEESHTTLHRQFKPYFYQADDMLARVMGAAGSTKIGEEKAKAIIAKFGSLWQAASSGLYVIPKEKPDDAMSQWQTVPGIGATLARDFLRGIGRTDVQ